MARHVDRTILIALIKNATRLDDYIVNKGWKSMGSKRGYICRVTNDGVYVRDSFYSPGNPEIFVVWDDILTLTCRGENRSMWDWVNHQEPSCLTD